MAITRKPVFASFTADERRAAGATFQPSLRQWQAQYKAQKATKADANQASEEKKHE
jgi:hypothetical protein